MTSVRYKSNTQCRIPVGTNDSHHRTTHTTQTCVLYLEVIIMR